MEIDGIKWLIVKGGVIRYDLAIVTETNWKQDSGINIAIPEFYYIPVSSSPLVLLSNIKLFIAIDSEKYREIITPEEINILDEPMGIISKVKYANPNIATKPPYFVLSHGSAPYQPMNPWIGLLFSVMSFVIIIYFFRRSVSAIHLFLTSLIKSK